MVVDSQSFKEIGSHIHLERAKIVSKWLTCFDASLLLQLLVKTIGVACHLTLNGNRLCYADDASTQSGCSCTKSANMIRGQIIAEQHTVDNAFY